MHSYALFDSLEFTEVVFNYREDKQLYELSLLRESGRFLTDKALWGVATDRCMKTTHNAFTMLLMCFTGIFQTQIR